MNSIERNMSIEDEIPIIDFSFYLNGNDVEQRKVAEDIRHACENVGFFYLKNFGFEKNLFDRVYQQAKRYFDQSFEKKMKLFIGLSTINRGYTPFYEEKLSTNGDFKEAFDFAFELNDDDQDRIHRQATLYGPNRWPDDLPGFRSCLYDEFYLKVIQLGFHLLDSFSISLNLDKNYFRRMFETKPMITMRILHYPSSTNSNSNEIGCGEHTDYECFTFLSQTNHSALEILHKDQRWIVARPIENTFIVNIGDLMQRWTNDRFKSTIHRVINRTGEDRYSIPIFFGPNYFTIIEPLFDQNDQQTKEKYPPIIAGKYLEERFDQTYHYRSQSSSLNSFKSIEKQ